VLVCLVSYHENSIQEEKKMREDNVVLYMLLSEFPQMKTLKYSLYIYISL
jgi:hypothetical protein